MSGGQSFSTQQTGLTSSAPSSVGGNTAYSYNPPVSGGVLGASTSAPAGGQLSQPQPQQQQPQQQQQPAFDAQAEASRQRAAAELQEALGQYDYLEQQMQGQIGEAGTQKTSALASLGEQKTQAENRAGSLTQEAEESTTTASRKALSTAQDVTKKNRNVLRAMGILSSSAAGEMLSKPMEEYGTQAADLQQTFIKRKGQVEDWLSERIVEYNNAKTGIEDQFNDIVNKINTDIRFNKSQKLNAVQQANAAFSEQIASLQFQAQEYLNAATEYKNNMAMQMAQIQSYQSPGADVSGILSQQMQAPQQAKPLQVGTLMSDEDKKKYGLLSG